MSAIEQTAFHFSLDSNLLHKESDEAQRQIARQDGTVDSSDEDSGVEENEEVQDSRPDGDIDDQQKGKKAEKQLRNQFNFSERASQTLNNPYRVI